MERRVRTRACTSPGSTVVDIWKRQVGELSSINFARRLRASEDHVLRLDIFKKLHKHTGCVNTISFSSDGDILISGSDDRMVILWDWQGGNVKLLFHSGHDNNVFQAKFMPYTDDRSIVTCGADGQVRNAQILDSGKIATKLLGKHRHRVEKMAIEPGSPHVLYTCGEDGFVQRFDLRTEVATRFFVYQPVREWSYMPPKHLNAIAIDPRSPNLFAVAGANEFALIFDTRKYKWDGSTDFGHPVDSFCPPHLIGEYHEHDGITGLAFSDQSELLVSYSDEFIYLFSKDMGLGSEPMLRGSDSIDMWCNDDSLASTSGTETDVETRHQVYKGHKNSLTVKGVTFIGPNCEYVASGSDCGRIFIWKKKNGELMRVMKADKRVVNCIEPHPHTPVLASSGIDKDIKIWTPMAIDRATLPAIIDTVWGDSIDNNSHDLFDVGSLITYDESEDNMEEEEDDESDTDSDDDSDEGDDGSDYSSMESEDEFDDDVSTNTEDEDDAFDEPCDDGDDDDDIP